MLREVDAATEEGVGGVILFGLPDSKDATGSPRGMTRGRCQTPCARSSAVSAARGDHRRVHVRVHVDHGHCGILRDGEVDNDASLELLARAALAYAAAGADIVAPSDMMDGRVGAIRRRWMRRSFTNTAILAYAAKYASAFYGPFREAAESTPKSGDRRGYQMDPANSDEAMREVWLDIEEGADAVMVKPAGPYLDIVARVKQETGYPVAAYQVSGEYAMILAAAERGWIDRERAMLESLMGIRRAGADFIITYFATETARLLS